MNTELTEFLRCHNASSDLVARLEALGIETLTDAWNKTMPKDLIWIVTRPGVMSSEQRRKFLGFILGSIKDKLTDPRSKNILDKLRTNSPITDADVRAADAEVWAATATARSADAEEDVAAYAAPEAAEAYAEAADLAARATWAAEAAAWAAEAAWSACVADAAWAADAAADAAAEAAYAAEAADAREKQAAWIRTNFKLADLHTN